MITSGTARLRLDRGASGEDTDGVTGALWELVGQVHAKGHLEMYKGHEKRYIASAGRSSGRGGLTFPSR